MLTVLLIFKMVWFDFRNENDDKEYAADDYDNDDDDFNVDD